MAVPLITDLTVVDAAGWWNPLSVLTNDNEADIAALDIRLTAVEAAIAAIDALTPKIGVSRRRLNDQVVNNSAAMQNDNVLTWPVTSGVDYVGDVYFTYSSGTTPDFKVGWSTPAASSMRWSVTGIDTAGAFLSTGWTLNSSAVQALGGAAVAPMCQIHLVFTAGANGNLTLQWAQNTADPTDTTMRNGSYGVLRVQ